jgi:DNA-binding MarR family transcriptional regulator
MNEELLTYQARRLQNLMTEMLKCCEDRKLYESHRLGLPHAELKVLMAFNGERYLTVKGIAQNMDVAKSRVSTLIKSLMERGLVTAVDDPKDGRIKLIAMTRSGEEKAREIRSFQREIHRKILMQLGDEQRKNLLNHLEMLRSSMEAVKEQLV